MHFETNINIILFVTMLHHKIFKFGMKLFFAELIFFTET